MTFGRIASLVIAAVIWAAVPAVAQTLGGTTGAINGRVEDESQAVLPGVTVTITSRALMGAQTAVTNEQGTYRFPSVPPGDYRLAFEMPGFTTVVREGVRVGAAFTATINVRLGVAALEESVTVSGAAPALDTQATRVQTNFTKEQLDTLPGARDMWAILSQSPAVQMSRFDVGGATAGTQSNYSAYGGGPNRPMVEGMVMTQGSGGSSFMYYDYGAFEEVVVTAAGHGADMPSPGIQMQFIAKSGGNTFSGRTYADYQNEKVQSRNINAEQIRLGAVGGDSNRMFRYHFVNADAGGPIKRDKIWWYASFMDQRILARVPNLPSAPTDSLLRNITGKVTYQASRKDKFIGFYQGNYKYFPNRVDGARVTSPIYVGGDDATRTQDYYAYVAKGEWNHVVSDRAFFEVRAGRIYYRNEYTRRTDEPRREDLSTNITTGGQLNIKPAGNPSRAQLIGMLSLFRDWKGSHNFKFGGEFFKEGETSGLPGDHVANYFNNTTPVEVDLFQGPTLSKAGLWSYSAYANDTWDVASRVSLNLGVRFDGYQPFLPEQEHPAGRFFPVAQRYEAADNLLRWSLWAPRVGVVFKLTEDGRTVLKANGGRYWWTPTYSFAASVNPNAGQPFLRHAWSDLNENRQWDPGEEGRLISRGGGTNVQLDPDLEDTYSNELAGWLEREVGPNFALRTGVVWRGVRQRYESRNIFRSYDAFNVPVAVRDPGPDGQVGTPDDGNLFNLLNLDPTQLGRVENRIRNVAGKDDYYTWELTGTRRKTGRWSLVAGFSYLWTRDNQRVYFGNAVRAANLPASPNDIVNTEDGRYNFTTWTGKVHGTYDAPWNVKVTPLLRHQSGQPFGRTFVAAMNYGSQVVLAEPIATHRQANVTLFDVRLEKYFPVGGRRKIGAFLDVYNVFNTNPEQQIVWSAGASFLRPVIIVPPRIVRFGTKFEW